jgi:hypothetical protein
MSGPISPDEVVAAKANSIPDEVFDVVNELIAEKWSGRYALVLQRDIVARLKAYPKFEDVDFAAKGWLDFEPIYRQKGWGVEYDKPGYNETYPASFKFTKS